MPEPVSEEHLKCALVDALRGLQLPPPHGKLTEQERHMIADRIFERLKLSKWTVSCEPATGFAALYRGPGEG